MTKYLALLFLFVGCNNQCDLLPMASYELKLTNKGADTDACYSQSIRPDLTTDTTFANSFEQGCKVALIQGCGTTELDVVCIAFDINVRCVFNGMNGECTDTHSTETCNYDAELIPQ